MANNHGQPGKVLTLTNSTGATIVAGQPFPFGSSYGVALVTIPNGESGSVALDESYHLVKASASEVIAQGANVFHDASNVGKVISASPDMSVDRFMGKAVAASANGDTTVEVLLDSAGYYELDTVGE